MRSRKYFYAMVFCAALFVSSCSTSDEADTESSPISTTSDGTKIETNTNPDFASISTGESVYETNPIDPEAELINAANGRVVRTNPDTLQINLENGEKVILNNFLKDLDGANNIRYIFSGFDEISGCYLIDLQLHEAYGVLFVNARDGTEQRLPGLPIYNPSKNMFVSNGGGGPILDVTIEIYSIEDLQMKNVFHSAPDWWTIQNASWENDTTIVLNVGIYSGTDDSGYEVIVDDKAKIQIINGEWQIIHPDLYEKMQRDKAGQN